jgi:peptidoglycan/xylan/chitin deacetylase (PgdA/CDA1 family)
LGLGYRARVFSPVSAVLRLWAAAILNLVLRLTRRRAGVALLYHAIDIRRGDPSRELVPPVERSQFKRHLRHLRRFYDVVSVDQFLTAVSRRRRGQRFPVCLTFDDDLRQHVEHALPILLDEGLPATFFLSGAGLDGSRRTSPWWERLQRAFDQGRSGRALTEALPPGAFEGLNDASLDIHRVAAAIEGLPADQRQVVSSMLLELAGPDPPDPGLGATEIHALAHSGCAIGFHTRRHDPLPTLGDDALARAFREGRDQLSRFVASPVDIVAYPHGRADQRVATAARDAAFRMGFTTKPRATTPTTDAMLIGRFEPVAHRTGMSMSHGAFAFAVVRTLSQDQAE